MATVSVEHKPTQFQTSNFEVDSPRRASHSLPPGQTKLRVLRAVDAARAGLALLCLCAGVVVLGVSADALSVYDETHVPADFLLPLWPDELDLRPTVALVAGGAVVVLANGASLVADRISFIRRRPILHAPLSVGLAFLSLVAALVAMSLFYAANTSDARHTVQSWSCRWRDVFMASRPHFGTLCRQSKAGLYLAVSLVPLEVVAVTLSLWQALLARNVGQHVLPTRVEQAKEGSPVPSSRDGGERREGA